ncbi:6-bladed beta-propeller [Maribacter sp. 2307ULW6-5]|uniref:6-bladed beta-propeller n=1 Tax=Maribacter sp. 2307ULW6-5 TaxID=3386275 RepID=UPI0039BC89A3
MERRKFIKKTAIGSAGFLASGSVMGHLAQYKDTIIGHNDHRYRIDMGWGALNAQQYPVNDCHEMVQDSKGRILLLTNHTKNNVIVYDKSGKLIEVWGTEYPGAHGLTLKVEGGEDFLYISDNARHEVIKTTVKGKVVQVFPYPEASGKYKGKDSYVPTETAIADNGDVYVADGYGEQYILHYSSKGELLNVFGGKGNGEAQFQNAHGICIDDRGNGAPTLLITARQQNRLKRFSLSGDFIASHHFPGAFICRPVIDGECVYLATIWSNNGEEGSGFISILDKDNNLISAPGGCAPKYGEGGLNKMYQALSIFTHPHDVCVDEDENLYVAQWNSGKTYPIKLVRT